MIRTSIGLVAASAAVLLGSGPASAVATGPAPGPRLSSRPDLAKPDRAKPDRVKPGYSEPGSQLTLTYMAEAGFAMAVKLTCEPAGGGHPDAAAACATLTETGADPAKIAPVQGMCMMIYAPITAEITGTWRGTPVAWTHKYGNGCEMKRATGVLFQF
ncbi:SSI family serine proteinase inhibitor [Micromonosporaceae bacterium Da 78-11]